MFPCHHDQSHWLSARAAVPNPCLLVWPVSFGHRQERKWYWSSPKTQNWGRKWSHQLYLKYTIACTVTLLVSWHIRKYILLLYAWEWNKTALSCNPRHTRVKKSKPVLKEYSKLCCLWQTQHSDQNFKLK